MDELKYWKDQAAFWESEFKALEKDRYYPEEVNQMVKEYTELASIPKENRTEEQTEKLVNLARIWGVAIDRKEELELKIEIDKLEGKLNRIADQVSEAYSAREFSQKVFRDAINNIDSILEE